MCLTGFVAVKFRKGKISELFCVTCISNLLNMSKKFYHLLEKAIVGCVTQTNTHVEVANV